MSILSCHQPHYIPSIQYFSRIKRSDVFILQDDLLYIKQDWINRNRVNVSTGIKYLTIPVGKQDKKTVNEVFPSNDVWVRKHLDTLKMSYSNTPGWKLIEEDILYFYNRVVFNQPLSIINGYFINVIANRLDLPCIIKTSSMYDFGERYDNPSERNSEMCQYFGCDTYLAGASFDDYADKSYFEGIKVIYDDWEPIEYTQKWVKKFEPNLSIIDLICACISWEEVKDKL